MDKIRDILDRAEHSALNDDERKMLLDLAESYMHLLNMVGDKRTSISRLRKLVFGAQTEKMKNVLRDGQASVDAKNVNTDGEAPAESPDRKDASPTKRKGHGRNGAAAYKGANQVKVPHESLRQGDQCPVCPKGKVYVSSAPGVIVRVTGRAPLEATVYELEKLRCNLCGKVFTAAAPEGIGEKKYDARSASMIALLKYGSGLPFNRLGGLQRNLGIPLPPSPQWDVIESLANELMPVYRELIRHAAQGEVLHNDDTGMKILELMGKRHEQRQADPEEDAETSDRTGVFTSGVVSTAEGARVALFFTGTQHAGENLADVLAERASHLDTPIQMCDALSRNTSPDFETIVANCLAHGRRKFVDVVENFPDECRHVLETLGEVYKHDAAAAKYAMSPQERLQLHQTESKPLMDKLHKWMTTQLDGRQVEPNSGLGQAIGYMLRHWQKLTLFMRVPGAPLDNNICERALKKAILHRKNSLFYKTENGARVGDLFMSLIYTCQLAETNAFDYLTDLQKHSQDATDDPAAWMPWNYPVAVAATNA